MSSERSVLDPFEQTGKIYMQNWRLFKSRPLSHSICLASFTMVILGPRSISFCRAISRLVTIKAWRRAPLIHQLPSRSRRNCLPAAGGCPRCNTLHHVSSRVPLRRQHWKAIDRSCSTKPIPVSCWVEDTGPLRNWVTAPTRLSGLQKMSKKTSRSLVMSQSRLELGTLNRFDKNLQYATILQRPPLRAHVDIWAFSGFRLTSLALIRPTEPIRA